MLDQYKKEIERLRGRLLFGSSPGEPEAPPQEDLGLGCMSEQNFLLALAALDQAERFMQIAAYHYARKD